MGDFHPPGPLDILSFCEKKVCKETFVQALCAC